MLEAYVPTTVDIGRPQEGLEALAAYPAASSKPALILDRARAHESARKSSAAAKDYQTDLLQVSASDEAEEPGSRLPRFNKQLRKEFPYAAAKCRTNAPRNL